MKTEDITTAIAPSISHTEIVRVEVADIKPAYAQVASESDDCDSCNENDGSLDLWGSKDGSDFRLRLIVIGGGA